MPSRSLLASWIFGLSLWAAAMGALALNDARAACLDPEASATVTRYVPGGVWVPYQEPTGRYAVSVRDLRPI
jgi:hypothetical protein